MNGLFFDDIKSMLLEFLYCKENGLLVADLSALVIVVRDLACALSNCDNERIAALSALKHIVDRWFVHC